MTRVTYPCHIYFSSATLKASKQAKSLKVGRLTNIFLPLRSKYLEIKIQFIILIYILNIIWIDFMNSMISSYQKIFLLMVA